MSRALNAIGLGTAVVCALVVVLMSLGLPVSESLGRLFQGSFGSGYAISNTLVKSTPLILTALGVIVAWRAGMYSIGGEGQFIIGGVCGAAIFKFGPQLPTSLLSVLILLMGIVGGALYSFIPGLLAVKRGIQVVISTILLNFIAIQVLGYVVTGPLKDPKSGLPMTSRLPDLAMLQRFDRQSDLHAGIFIAVAILSIVAVAYWLTPWGFRLRLVGDAPRVARANRLPVDSEKLIAMAISGGLCGLAGAIEYVGLAGQLSTGFTQNWGFLAIPVAILANLNPVGVALTAPLFGALFAGSDNLARFTKAGSAVVAIVQAVVVLGYLAVDAVRRNRE
ncbi:MAG TPA: ABC transporter permease [Fimbriimonadaceae bacterium]|nr:ABC transporter permease [Fimbriimonadaceae bacterium]